MKKWLYLGALALLLSACTLAGDITPPPGTPVTIPVDQPSSLELTSTAPADASATTASQLAEQMGTISGQVLNGTLNTGVPAGLAVTLHAFDAHSTTPETATTLTTTTSSDGAFQFDEVAFSASRQFVVTALYGETSYGTELLAFAPGESALETTLHVYESTSDASVLRVDQVHTFVEFASPQAMTVGQLYVFSNDGNATYGADGQASLHFGLPAGATDVSVQGALAGEDLVATESGFDLAQPVAPGERSTQVLLSFTLPYAGALDFEQPLAYPVESLNVLITDLAVSVSDSPLQALGIQDSMGMQFQNFEQTGLESGDTLRFRLSGEPQTTAVEAAALSEQAAPAPTRPWGLIAGLGGTGVGLVIAGGWLYLKRAPARKPAANREALLQDLAALDERYDAGQVDRAEYGRERDRLKRQLREQWS